MDSETDCHCIIEDLMKKNFESRSPSEKENIVKLGRPIPKLNITKQTKAFVRHFQKDWYEITPWLCGCLKLQKNFCWPCLLYSKESSVWNKFGFNDLNNLSKSRKRHEINKSHIVSFVKLRLFEKQCHSERVPSLPKISTEKFNRTATANRYIITKLINIICYLSGQYLTLQSQVGFEPTTKGSYVEFIYLLSSLDSELKFHLDESTVLRESSKKIQNDLIHSIGHVLTEEIIKEIKLASHSSIILNVVTNVVHGSQLTTVLRYAMKGTGDVRERFVAIDPFIRSSEDCAIIHHIHNCYEKYGLSNLFFAAHSYDGSAVSVNGHKDIQAKMKAIYKHSIFTYCYTHHFDLVFSQCVGFIKDCELFFQTLTGFSSFFSKCPKRLSALNNSVKARTELTNYSSIINCIINHQKEIKQLLTDISESPNQWDVDTAMAAKGLHHHLTDFNFHFWLLTFNKIFSQSNVLFDKLFEGTLDTSLFNMEATEFITSLQDIRDNFDSIWYAVKKDKEITILDTLTSKRIRLDKTIPDKETFRRTFNTVIDAVSQTCLEKYSDFKSLRFMSLLSVNEFKEFSQKFPEPAFNTLVNLYGPFFDFPKLKAELLYLYSCPELAETSLEHVKDTLTQNKLHEDVLKEVHSFIMMMYTMPCIRPPMEEGKLSTMERIQRFLKYTQPEEELSSWALVCVEREFLISIQESKPAEFYERVIRHFGQKNPSILLRFNT